MNSSRRKGPLIVGISGATCGGKTTVSELLKATFPWAQVVHQDAYFHPNEPQYHVYLPKLNYFNFELESALDFTRMENDVRNLLAGNRSVIMDDAPFFDNAGFVHCHRPDNAEVKYLTRRFSKVPIFVLEGHIILNRPFLYEICEQKYFLMLGKKECERRRQSRTYNPKPPVEFFDTCVWPAYEARFATVKNMLGITLLNAETNSLIDLYRGIKENMLDALYKTRAC